MMPAHPLAKLAESRAGIYLQQFLAEAGCSTPEQFYAIFLPMGVSECSNCSREVDCWLIPAAPPNDPGYPACLDCFCDYVKGGMATAYNDQELRAEAVEGFGDPARFESRRTN